MTEDEARAVELVRAIEGEDRDAALLTREDLAQAEAHARVGGGLGSERRDADAFIGRRAAFASARLATRHPGVAALLHKSRWPRWMGVALPTVALVAGFAANEFGTGKRLDLLAVPLLGTIAWNLLVYLGLGAALLQRRPTVSANPLHRVIGRIAGLGHRDLDRGTALHRAATAFQVRWAAVSAPLAGARIARTLHLGAALFAAGLIGGIYLRALVIEYRAGWESTFLGPASVHTLLSAVLGPASWLSGLALPSVQGIAAMRWTGPASGGVNAAPWIHLYTVTVAGLVIAPRLLLASWHGAKALRLARRFPVAGREDFYVRRLLRSADGAPGTARITPYAYRPGEETRRRLSAALRAALGEGAQVRFDQRPGRRLSHRAVYAFRDPRGGEPRRARRRTRSAHSARSAGTVLAAVIDESPFRAHFAGQAGLDGRIADRLAAWRQVLAGAGVTPLGLDLSQEVDAGLAQRIESGLLTDGAMR